LTREARGQNADGLLTLSARVAGGINAPIFRRHVLSDPRIIGAAAITADPGSYRVELQ
jgi:hypothetical protein